MDKYLNEIRKIDLKIDLSLKDANQFTIDFVENILIDLDRDADDNPVLRDEIGAIIYDIENILTIINPLLKFDISVFTELMAVLNDWYEKIDFVNKALGIPREKG